MILKKLLTKSGDNEQEIFPKSQQIKAHKDSDQVDPKLFLDYLVNSPELLDYLTEIVTSKLLTTLSTQYGFEPSNKYLEEIENKKKYINQLDTYLAERRDINVSVENELQLFLQETSTSLSKSLEVFTLSIQKRIKEAENKHGIDMIKESLLSGKADIGESCKS